LFQPLRITRTTELKKLLTEVELNTIIQKLNMETGEVEEINNSKERKKEIVKIKNREDLMQLLDQLLLQKEAAILLNRNLSIAWHYDKVYSIHLKQDLLEEGLEEEEA